MGCVRNFVVLCLEIWLVLLGSVLGCVKKCVALCCIVCWAVLRSVLCFLMNSGLLC